MTGILVCIAWVVIPTTLMLIADAYGGKNDPNHYASRKPATSPDNNSPSK